MRTHTLTLRSATTAIAAVLVLGSTPLLAQAVSPTGDPVILAPVPTAVAPPVTQTAPAAAPVTTSAPIVQSLPSTYVPATDAAPDAVPSATPSAAPKRVVAAPAKRAGVTAPVAAAAPFQAPAAVPAEPAANPELFPASETAQNGAQTGAQTGDVITTPKPAADAVDGFTVMTGVLGGLVLIGMGWFGVVLARRRKIHKSSEAVAVTRPVVTPRNEPLIVTRAAVATPAAPAVSVSDPAPVMADPKAIPASPQPIRANMEHIPAVARAENAFGAGHPRWADSARQSQPAATGALPSNGASVDLPAKVPADYDDRDALLKRMIVAKPDKANPYTDRRARMKRARLILQSLGQNFAGRDPWIDLSQYPNNWPELAHRGYPQAA